MLSPVAYVLMYTEHLQSHGLNSINHNSGLEKAIKEASSRMMSSWSEQC